MSIEPTQITGVVLAGGRGRRMDGKDKGLLPFRGRLLVEYSLDALRPLASTILISANRNREVYAGLGHPVIADGSDRFDGPLAGLHSALLAAETPYVLCLPCDVPLIDSAVLSRLCETLEQSGAEVCAAHDGTRLHPLILLAERRLAPSLGQYLAEGNRKVESWLASHRLALADCSDCPERFVNLNSPWELAALERETE